MVHPALELGFDAYRKKNVLKKTIFFSFSLLLGLGQQTQLTLEVMVSWAVGEGSWVSPFTTWQ